MSPTLKKVRTVDVDARDVATVTAFKAAAESYVEKLPDWGVSHLFTKPFYTVGRAPETVQIDYLHDAAHILRLLDLPGGSHVLDVACGPGWLAEILYRFGYRVTGIDISEDLLRIARQRIGSLPFPPRDREPSWAEFLRLDIEQDTPSGPFAGIVLYDCLHHFVDARGVLERLRGVLAPGGRLVVKEGAMPDPGSEGEANLLAETQQYGTLEAPFDPAYLHSLLRTVGFDEIQSFAQINDPIEQTRATRTRVRKMLKAPADVNFFLCRAGAQELASPWRAAISVRDARLVSTDQGDDEVQLSIAVANVGQAIWRANGTLDTGNVCLGFRLLSPQGEILEEHAGRTPLAQELRPSDSVEVEVRYRLPPALHLPYTLTCDVVLQGEFWFSERGSPVACWSPSSPSSPSSPRRD